jgi:hypothetical protein
LSVVPVADHMRTRITIDFGDISEPMYRSRVHNFCSDLWRTFRDSKEAYVDSSVLDGYQRQVHILLLRRSYRRRALKQLDEILKPNHLTDFVEIRCEEVDI